MSQTTVETVTKQKVMKKISKKHSSTKILNKLSDELKEMKSNVSWTLKCITKSKNKQKLIDAVTTFCNFMNEWELCYDGSDVVTMLKGCHRAVRNKLMTPVSHCSYLKNLDIYYNESNVFYPDYNSCENDPVVAFEFFGITLLNYENKNLDMVVNNMSRYICSIYNYLMPYTSTKNQFEDKLNMIKDMINDYAKNMTWMDKYINGDNDDNDEV